MEGNSTTVIMASWDPPLCIPDPEDDYHLSKEEISTSYTYSYSTYDTTFKFSYLDTYEEYEICVHYHNGDDTCVRTFTLPECKYYMHMSRLLTVT